jgi:hypothetical protein
MKAYTEPDPPRQLDLGINIELPMPTLAGFPCPACGYTHSVAVYFTTFIFCKNCESEIEITWKGSEFLPNFEFVVNLPEDAVELEEDQDGGPLDNPGA